MIVWNRQSCGTLNTRVYVAPLYNTVTIGLLKKYLKWEADDDTENDVMNQCLVSAIKEAESYTRRTIEKCTYRSYLNGFQYVKLDVTPVILSTLVVKYFNDSNVESTLSSSEYIVTDYGDDYATLEFTGTMPTLYDKRENVFLEYDAGYPYYPEDLTTKILRKAGDYFEVRTNQVNGNLTTVDYDFHKGLFPYKILC